MTGAGPPLDTLTTDVEIYKTILRDILDQRPSGTRQRLATALGKNRSFVSQISNPIYPVPIPAKHLEIIFDICHFPPADKRAFLAAFARAHPNRLRHIPTAPTRRILNLEVPDFGSTERNRKFDDLVQDMMRRLARFTHRAD